MRYFLEERVLEAEMPFDPKFRLDDAAKERSQSAEDENDSADGESSFSHSNYRHNNISCTSNYEYYNIKLYSDFNTSIK